MWADKYEFVGGFNRYKGIDFDTEDLVNLYPIKDPKGKKGIALLNTPGLKEELRVQAGNAESRALFVFEDKMYGVFGPNVYQFDSGLEKVALGTLSTDMGYVSITVNNARQISFVDGQGLYIYNVGTGAFSKVTTEDVPPSPLNVAFLDTYFVIPSSGGQQFQISANNDGTLWNAFNDEAQIQTYPGVLVGVGVVNERLYFFKTDSTEIWYDAGQADFPLRKDTNLIFNYGCLATSSIVSEYGYLFWLAKDKSGPASVMMTTGETPTKISSPAVEWQISQFTAPENVSCYIYKEEGHIFYVMNWTIDDLTLCYDVTTNEWHRREMIKKPPKAGDPNYSRTRNLPNCHAYFNGKHYVGSYKEPVLYSMSRTHEDNAGEPIKRERTGNPFFDPDYRMLQIKRMQVDIQPGLGKATGIYSDPKAFLSLSKDGGHVFGNRQPGSIGKIGQRQARAIWRKKGLYRSCVPRVTIYASVAPIVIMGFAIEFEVLPK